MTSIQELTPVFRETLKNRGVGDTRLEHPQQCCTFGETVESAAPGAAPDPTLAPLDPGLAEAIDAWPTLPETARADILAMIRAAK